MKGIRTTSREHYFRSTVIYFLIYCLVLNTWLPVVLAAPSGGSFMVGDGNFDYGVDSTVTVNKAKSVIEWGGGIDTSSNESLTFLQKEGLGLSNSAVLNRIMSGNPTQFDGTLNGVDMRIFIVNPAGVFFGEGSSVNVNQLVASGLGMSDSDFSNAIDNPMNKMVFSGGSGNVTNDGTINAINSVYLVGYDVTNNGAILCPDGLVVMAAGDTLRLGQPGSDTIVEVSNIKTDLVADSDNDVTNNGTVGEDGSPVGELVLAAGDIFSQAIANVDEVAVIARDDVELRDITVTGQAEVYSGLGGVSDSTINVEGDITAGSITLQAGNPEDSTARKSNINIDGVLHSTDGDIVASAREHITLDGDVLADNGHIYVMADSDGLGRGNLNTENIEATNGDVELIGRIVDIDGDAIADGDMTIRAMSDWGLEGGGTVSAGTLQSGGILDVSVRESLTDDTIDGTGQITLNGDAIAGEDLILHNNTDMTASGAKLEAGGDVVLANGDYPEGYDGACSELTGYEELSIIAGTAEGVDDGIIYAENTTISVTGSSLILEQDLDLNLDSFTFVNQEDTHLTANSNSGSVTAVETGTKPENAADMWASIGATAYTDITISGDTKDITTSELTSETGNIEVNAKAGQLLAGEMIEAATGNVNLSGIDGIDADGDIIAGTNVNLNDNTVVADGVTISAGQDMILVDDKTLTGEGDLAIDAGRHIYLGDDVQTSGGIALVADADGIDGGVLQARGNITSGGDLYAEAGESIHIEGDALAQDNMTLFAHGSDSDITVDGALTTNNGDIDISSTYYIELGGPVEAYGNLTMSAHGGDYDSYVYAEDSLSSLTGYTQIVADLHIELDGPVTAYGDLTMDADVDDNGDGEIRAHSTLTSETGSVYISSSDDTQYLYDDVTAAVDIVLNDNTFAFGDLLAGRDVTINSDLTLNGGDWVLNDGLWSWEDGDQSITASSGTVTATSWIWKETPGQLFIYGGSADLAVDLQYPGDLDEEDAAVATAGNLYILGNGDIQIAGDLTALGGLYWDMPDLPKVGEGQDIVEPIGIGGVSVISENGKIYTQDDIDNDTLNVAIEGASSQADNIGVVLGNPYGELPLDPDKKAAIVIKSNDDLKLGQNAELYADGIYDATIIDDRAAVGLLDVPATIGGYPRNEGDPIDVAVYLASTGTDTDAGQGNIDLEVGSVEIDGQGTMVIDAYDTVSFGESGVFDSGVFNISRMEVVSRITEWLYQAVGHLPFAGDSLAIAAFEDIIGGDYVLRGAGLDNIGITDARAWILENFLVAAAPLPENVELGVSGCPALIQWAADELGIEGQMAQIWIVNTLASSRDIQPCDACANLRAAATVLQDADGTHIAAMAQVINEFASSTAPPSEEQMASIADAIANNTEAGNAYALAGEYIDALVAYVGVLEDLGYSSEDSITVASDKYIAPLAEGDNVGLAAYVSARLTSLGG